MAFASKLKSKDNWDFEEEKEGVVGLKGGIINTIDGLKKVIKKKKQLKE